HSPDRLVDTARPFPGGGWICRVHHGDRGRVAPNRERTTMRRDSLRNRSQRQQRGAPRTAAPADRFIPRLVELERRECPSLSVGDNANLSIDVPPPNSVFGYDNQNNPTVAIDASGDPTLPPREFEAHMEWRRGVHQHHP